MQEEDTIYEEGKKNELELMTIVKDGKFQEIESKLKPSALMYCQSNSLIMGMKVSGYFCVPGLRQVVCAYLLGPVKALI